jgi:hypothetical protein
MGEEEGDGSALSVTVGDLGINTRDTPPETIDFDNGCLE